MIISDIQTYEKRYTTFPNETSPIPYKSLGYPGRIDPRKVISHPTEGGNCESFYSATALSRGFFLPSDMRVAELLLDTQYTLPVELPDVVTGDAIAVFTKKRHEDPMYAHLGTAVVEDGEVLFLHLSNHHKKVVLERLEDVLNHDKYGEIAGIKRPIIRGSFIAAPAEIQLTP